MTLRNRKFASLLLGVSLLGLMATTSNAIETFYESTVDVGRWYVYGNTANKKEKMNPVCVAESRFKDGSRIQLTKDLDDDELYIKIQNMEWNIDEEYGKTYKGARINFKMKNGNIEGKNGHFFLVNKNTIVLPNLNGKFIIDNYETAAVMDLIMPGSINNLRFSLEGSTQALKNMVECIKKSKTINLYDEKETPKINKGERLL